MKRLEAPPPLGGNGSAPPRYSYEQLLAHNAQVGEFLQAWWTLRPEVNDLGRHVGIVDTLGEIDGKHPISLEARRAHELDSIGRYLEKVIHAASDYDSSVMFTAGTEEVPASRFVDMSGCVDVVPTWDLSTSDSLELSITAKLGYRDDLHGRHMLSSHYGYGMEMMYFGDGDRMVWITDLAQSLADSGQLSIGPTNGYLPLTA